MSLLFWHSKKKNLWDLSGGNKIFDNKEVFARNEI